MLLVGHNYDTLGADHVELIVVHPTSKMESSLSSQY